jgi:hypothetical protein
LVTCSKMRRAMRRACDQRQRQRLIQNVYGKNGEYLLDKSNYIIENSKYIVAFVK